MSRKFILILQIYDSNLISDEGFIQFMKNISTLQQIE